MTLLRAIIRVVLCSSAQAHIGQTTFTLHFHYLPYCVHACLCTPTNASILLLLQRDPTSQCGFCVSSTDPCVHVWAKTCAPGMWLLKLIYSLSLFLNIT